MYSNFKVSFKIWIFTYNTAIQHNKQILLQLKMSISQYMLCVHNQIFQRVNVLFSVIEQNRINNVQLF